MRPPFVPQTVPVQEQEPLLTRILKLCYNHLVEYREPRTNRIVISLFMCLPSRKDFPEYFDIIDRPISMYEIRKRIERNHYKSEDDCIADFKLMFNNCRLFNEDLSQIYRDAVELERMLLTKYDALLEEHKPQLYQQKQQQLAKQRHPKSRLQQQQQSQQNNYNHHQNNHHQAQHINNNTNNNSNNLLGHTTSSNNNNNNQSSIANSISSDIDSNSNSNNYFIANGNGESLTTKTTSAAGGAAADDNNSFIIDHNFHNDISIDSNSNLSIGPDSSSLQFPLSDAIGGGAATTTAAAAATPRATKRLKRDPSARKKRLLTGYIIYAAEVRKEYVDKHPNQDFGFVSRLIGHDWKTLSQEARKAYDQRAIAHNKKLQEKIIRENVQAEILAAQSLQASESTSLTNGTSTPKMNKQQKMVKLANRGTLPKKSSSTPYPDNGGAVETLETATQTSRIRFVRPPEKRSLMDMLSEEGPSERPPEPEKWLGAGIGRFENTEAALWALRDFMLMDTATRRWNMQPYLNNN